MATLWLHSLLYSLLLAACGLIEVSMASASATTSTTTRTYPYRGGRSYVRQGLPDGAAAYLERADGTVISENSSDVENSTLFISAGELFVALGVELLDGSAFDVYGARLRVVNGSAVAAWEAEMRAALEGARNESDGNESALDPSELCAAGSEAELGPAKLDAPLYVPEGVPTEDARDSPRLESVPGLSVAFRTGGSFRVCYSYNGKLDANSSNIPEMLPTRLEVLGVTSHCLGHGCLADRTFPCYALLGEMAAPGACGVPLDGVKGALGSLTWSPAFTTTYGGDGLPLPIYPGGCGSSPAADVFMDPQPPVEVEACMENCTDTFTFRMLPNTLSLQSVREATLPPVVAFRDSKEATTVAVCYCTGLRGCQQMDYYTQQFGIIHLFVATVTLPIEPMCTSSMSGVLSPLPFIICVHCPPGACSFRSLGSRVRLTPRVPLTARSEVPPWTTNHSCHAMQSTVHLQPAGAASANADGGERGDYKQFRPSGVLGFSLASWPAFEQPGSDLDICICLDDCKHSSAWFKAGQLDVVRPRLMSSSRVVARAETVPPNKVRIPGQLSLHRPWMPYGDPLVLGLEPHGAPRLADFDAALDTSLTSACMRNAPVDAVGLTTTNASAYLSSTQDGRLVFDGGANAKFSIGTAGLAAVCYCATPSTGATSCVDAPWVPIGVISIAGPRFGQFWTLPTYTYTRIEFHGVELRGTDTIRIINATASCEAGDHYNFRETVVSPINTNYLCPPMGEYGSHEVCDVATRSTEYPTSILTYSTVDCDEHNVNCKPPVFIEAVNVVGHNTEVLFTRPTTSPSGLGDLGLAEDDVLVIGKGVDCGADCTPEMLELVRGFHNFAGLQRYMSLNEGVGALAKDPVGGWDARLNNVPLWVPGQYAQGLRFSTQSQSLSQAFSDLLDASRPWSLLLWAQVQNNGWHTLCALADTNGILEVNEMEIGVAGEPWPTGAVFLQQEGTVELNSTMENSTLETGWNHVAVVYSGAFDGRLLFYVNGDLRYQRDDVRLSPTSLPLSCGGGVDTSRERAPGWLDLDEIRWYNVALSSAEVTAVMSDPFPSADIAVQAGTAVGNRIRGSSDSKKWQLPGVSWSPEPSFEVDAGFRTGGGGHWSRTNRGVSRAEIITPNQHNVKVCWGRGGQYTEAGIIAFEHPANLFNVGMYFTSMQWEVAAPFVLTFTTNDASSATGRRYAAAEGPTTLTLTILRREQYDITSSTYDGVELVTNSESENEFHEASQSICGKLFLEMWSDDPSGGFPLPRGCYYRRLGLSMREIIIVFEARNSLRGGQKYQLVMNGIAYPQFQPDQEFILIRTGDDLDAKRYSGLEYGHAYGNRGFDLGPGKNDPQFRIDEGVEVVNGDERMTFELKDKSMISLRLRGASYGTGAIKRNCLLDLWFWPLTQWQIPTKCLDVSDRWSSGQDTSLKVHCHTYRGNFRRCGRIAKCLGYKVAPNEAQVNAIHLVFPDLMNDLFGTIVYQLDILQLNWPPGGIMPTKIAAQIRKPDGSKPDYTMSYGPYFYKMPDTGYVIGRLLTDGTNDVPYRGQTTYMIYLLLVLPVDVRGEDDSRDQPYYRPPSTMQLTAPEGFSCLGITAAPPTGLGQRLITSDGFAVSGLSNVVASAPTGFGTPDLRGWTVGSPDPRSCHYELLPRAFIPAYSSLVVGMRVVPMNGSLPITDPSNLWQVSVETPGMHNETLIDFSAAFYRTGPAGVPVLGSLSEALIQPSNQTVSRVGDTVVHNLSVFFRTEQGVSAGGSIEVEAPEAFNFNTTCSAQDLNVLHYVRGPFRRVYRLPTIRACIGSVQLSCPPPCLSSPLTTGDRPVNVARVFFEGPLAPKERYAFHLAVSNPSYQNISLFPGGDWVLRTRDPTGPAIDATKGKVAGFPTISASGTPWQLRSFAMHAFPSAAAAKATREPGMAIELSSSLPYRISGSIADVTMVLRVPDDIQGILRIAAPEGYSYSFSDPTVPQASAQSQASANTVPATANRSARNTSVKASSVKDNSAEGFHFTENASVEYDLTDNASAENTSVDNASAENASNESNASEEDARLPSSEEEASVDYVTVRNASAEFVADLDPVSNASSLQYFEATFYGGVQYTFTARIYVPSFSPVTSVPAFFVNLIDPLDGPGQGFSAVVPAKPVRQIVDAIVRSINRMPGNQTDLLFQSRQFTEVASPGGLSILLPRGYIIDNPCEARPWPGQQPWVTGTPMHTATCNFANASAGPTVFLRPSVGRPLPTGLLRFRVQATNPVNNTPGSCGPGPCWTFSSKSRCNSQECMGHILDAQQTYTGTNVAPEMARASLLTFIPQGRNDRPGEKSLLVFSFRVAEPFDRNRPSSPMPASDLELVGPVGFVFEELCHSGIETRRDVIFGSHLWAKRDWDIDEWSRSADVLGCEGIGEMAVLRVAGGLDARLNYAFQIPVRNPTELPAENNWTIAFQNRFSRPFASFSLWTFYDTALTPLSPHAGPTCYGDGTCIGAGLGIAVPVNIRFRPWQEIKTDGELHITMPEAFAFSPITPWPTNGQLVKTDQPTRCIVRQFNEGNLSSIPSPWEKRDRDCLIVSRGSPLDSSGTGDWRTMKIIVQYAYNSAEAALRKPKTFHRDHIYEISLFFDPPPGYRPPIKWIMESYSPSGKLMDVGFAPGYEVKPVLRRFQHSNAGINVLKNTLAPIVKKGLAPLVDFVLDLELPINAWPTDYLVITAPPGFEMQLGESGPCVATYILGPRYAVTPPGRTAKVDCDANVLTLYLIESQMAIQAGVQMRVLFMLSNPESPPEPDLNYWLVEQRSGVSKGLVAAAMAESWQVVPVIVDPSFNITGETKAGGTITNLALGFGTIQAGFEILIEAIEPHTFEFENALAYADVGGRSSQPQIMTAEDNVYRLGTAFTEFDRVTADILGVRIPETPGVSRWRLTTYKLPGEYGDPSVLCDEVFFDGFFVPGRITVPRVTAKMGAALLGKNSAELTFRLESSAALAAGDELQVGVEGAGAEGFELLPPQGDLLTESGEVIANVVPGSSGCLYPREASEMAGSSQAPVVRTLKLRLLNATVAKQQVLLRVPLITPPDRGVLALERWRFEVWRTENATRACDVPSGWTVATNDAIPFKVPVVTPLPTEPGPVAKHRSPITVITVEFRFDPLDTNAASMVVRAPLGYVFPADCLGEGSPPVSCTAFPGNVPGASAANIVCISGGTNCLPGHSTYLLVKTPRETVVPAARNTWFVEAMSPPVPGGDLGSGVRLGRATMDGFDIIDMPAGVIYAPMPGTPVDLAVHFTNRVNLSAGGYVHILAAPALDRFQCGTIRVGFIKSLALGETLSCEDAGPEGRARGDRLFINLRLNESLPPGDYALTVPAETPLQMPEASENLFEVKLRDGHGQNQDVALRLPGEGLVYGLQLIVWPLWWIKTVPWAEDVSVSVPLEVLEDANAVFAGLLIVLPSQGPLMNHLVSSGRDIKVSSGQSAKLPLARNWLEIPDTQSLLLRLDPNRRLATGLYVISFEVRLETEVKRTLDVWRVALCGVEMNDEGAAFASQACSLQGITRSGRGSAVRGVWALGGIDPSQAPDTGELIPGQAHVAATVSGSPGGPRAAGMWYSLRGLLAGVISIAAASAAS